MRARLAVAVATPVVVAHVVLHAQQASLASEVSRLVELLELRSDSVVASWRRVRRGQHRDSHTARTHEPRIRHPHQRATYRGHQAGRDQGGPHERCRPRRRASEYESARSLLRCAVRPVRVPPLRRSCSDEREHPSIAQAGRPLRRHGGAEKREDRRPTGRARIGRYLTAWREKR